MPCPEGYMRRRALPGLWLRVGTRGHSRARHLLLCGLCSSCAAVTSAQGGDSSPFTLVGT